MSAGIAGATRSNGDPRSDFRSFLALGEELRLGAYGAIELQVSQETVWVGWMDTESRYALRVGNPLDPGGENQDLHFLGLVRR